MNAGTNPIAASWRQRMLASAAAIASSIAIPVLLALHARPANQSVLDRLSSTDTLLLVFLLCLVAAAYLLIFAGFHQHLKNKHPGEEKRLERDHILPMSFLVCANTLTLGLLSVVDDLAPAEGTPKPVLQTLLCFNASLCAGSTVIEVFPYAILPAGIPIYALWGTLVYNVFQFLQRIGYDDFPASVWLYAAARLAAAIFASSLIFLLFFQEMFGFTSLGENKLFISVHRPSVLDGAVSLPGLAVFLAFFSGFFPRASLMTLYRLVVSRLNQLGPAFGKYEHTPLSRINGITGEVEDRLLEAGIDSAQMLSRTSVDELKDRDNVWLPYSRDVIADWIDQAKLVIYLDEERDLAAVRGLGIRTHSDLSAFRRRVAANDALREGLPLEERLKTLVLHGG